jgi:hypothetical protein
MFFDLLMQAAPAVIPAGADPNLTATFSIVTAVVAGIGSLVGFLKSKEASNFAGALGLAGIRKGTEAKEAVLRLAPEDKKALIRELKEEVMIGVKQEETVIAHKPAMNPNKLDIPRETHDTKPQV